MYFRGLATDYEGTLAEHGIVPAETVRALRRLGASGRRLILLTGRQLEDLRHIFPELALFDRVVAAAPTATMVIEAMALQHMMSRGQACITSSILSLASDNLRSGVYQGSCPPISCDVSDFRDAGFAVRVEPDGSGGLPVAGLA